MQTTRDLIDRCLKNDRTLRVLCGWRYKSDIPSESKFSRVFLSSWNEDLLQLCYFESDIRRENMDSIRDIINKFLAEQKIDTYDFLSIEMM